MSFDIIAVSSFFGCTTWLVGSYFPNWAQLSSGTTLRTAEPVAKANGKFNRPTETGPQRAQVC